MTRQKAIAVALVLTLLAGATSMAGADVKPRQETKAERDARMAWWRDVKFGMFIHWGLYAIPGGEWNGKVYTGISEWIQALADIPRGDYERLAPQFNPVKFDAAEWVRIAKAGGMKYLVITSKHHDGFAMYDSKVSDYDIIDRTPYGNDVLKAVSAECKKQGIVFCTYYSILDWHHPSQYPRYEQYYENLDENEVKSRAESEKEFRQQVYGGSGMKPGRKEEYVTYMKAQLKEIVTQYDPGVMWFDGDWTVWWTPEDGVDVMAFLWELNPDLIINNRAAGSSSMENILGDYGTPEQYIPGDQETRDWESCMTMNDSWGWKRSDQHWKPTEVLLTNLLDIVSKGGNFLLNVGPTPEGEIPEQSARQLKEIGDWLNINGEAIHGTKGWKTVKEGPVDVAFINSYEEGYEKFSIPPYTPQDILFTAKEGVVYAICLAWPEKPVTIKSMAGVDTIKSVSMLGSKGTLEWTMSDMGLVVTPPKKKPCEYAYVIKIEL